jgi:hypothetical protein
MRQFLGPEIVKMGQQSFWPQKLTLWVSFCAQQLTLWARDTLWKIQKDLSQAQKQIISFELTEGKNKLRINLDSQLAR